MTAVQAEQIGQAPHTGGHSICRKAELQSQRWDTSTEHHELSTSPGIASKKRWIQVLNGFVVFFNTWGLLLSFGGYQVYYEEVLLNDHTSSQISWISTFCAFALLAGGVVTGPMYDKGHFRVLLLCGIALEVFGLMMTSLSAEYYQLFLAQGLCIGIGGCLLYVPSIAAAASEFDGSTRPRVMGLIAAGTGIGGVIYPIVFRSLLDKIGFSWTVRVIGFIVLGTYILSCSVLWSKPRQASVRAWFEWSALKELRFACILIYAFFTGAAYYVPLLYIPQFTDEVILRETNSELSFYILAIINGASVVGRLIAGDVAARVGSLETALVSTLSSTVILFCWVAVGSQTGMIVWAILWGLSSSVIVALPGAIIPLLTPLQEQIGTRLGMYWVCVGVGILIGSPIGGALAGITSPIWWHVQVFAAFMMLAAAAALTYPVIWVRRRADSKTA